MTPRGVETCIARFTLALLLAYVPLETWASWPALTNPFYLVDVVGLALLLLLVVESRTTGTARRRVAADR